MRLNKWLLLVLLVFLTFGCQKKERKFFYFSTSENNCVLDTLKKEKIVVFVNGSCSCATEKISYYQDFLDSLGRCDQNLILCFIITSSDNFTLFSELIEIGNIKFSYPPLYDNTYHVLRQNKINIHDERSQTLLLDKNNEIIATGDIRLNQSLKQKYIRHIENFQTKL